MDETRENIDVVLLDRMCHEYFWSSFGTTPELATEYDEEENICVLKENMAK